MTYDNYSSLLTQDVMKRLFSKNPSKVRLDDLYVLNPKFKSLGRIALRDVYSALVEALLNHLKTQLKVDMNDDVYALNVYQKFELLWTPYIDYFEDIGRAWVATLIHQAQLKEHLTHWFLTLEGEVSVLIRYLEMAQDYALIRPLKDSDGIVDQLILDFIDLLHRWTQSSDDLKILWKHHLHQTLQNH